MNKIVELMKQEIINRSNKFEEETKGTKDEYNLYEEHVKYVYKYATMIAKEKNADLEIIELSALLHDIAMTDSTLDRSKHNEYGAIIAEELLLKENYPKDKIEKIKKCILNHSSKRKEYRTTLEEQILVDADAMAHFDSIDSLYSLAHNVIGLNDKDSLNFVKEKLTKDYNEISVDVQKYVKDRYDEIMENRMNKQELLELLESLKINKEEFWVLSSSALVLRGLFDSAGDLDIAVTEKGLEELKNNYNLKQKENGWYIVNDKVECVLDTKDDWKIEKYGDYYLESLTKYFEYLKNSTREKDKIKYEIVKRELEHQKII